MVMAEVTVSARIASTHPVAKYGGIRVARRVLDQMAAALNAGRVPMVLDHSALNTLRVRNLRADVVRLDDGEHAVEATFDVDETAWRRVQDRFAEAGVPGGFSYAAGELQIGTKDGGPPAIAISADAAAFSDEDRADVWALWSGVGPTQASRLYEFSVADATKVIIEMWPVVALGLGVNLTSSVIYDGLKRLVAKRGEPTVVELHRHSPDGTRTKAVVTTNDTEVVRAALEALRDDQSDPVLVFDVARRLWLPPDYWTQG
jgi:hypothetical protein